MVETAVVEAALVVEMTVVEDMPGGLTMEFTMELMIEAAVVVVEVGLVGIKVSMGSEGVDNGPTSC